LNQVLSRILISLGSAILSYIAIIAFFLLTGIPKDGKSPSADASQMSFEELYFSYEGLPDLQAYTARDGAALDYRHYPAESSDKVLILLHGSGWHNRYLLPLAEHISSQNLAHVYTPDLRGHGENPAVRGDVDYIGQYEDDIADLIAIIRKDHPDATLIMGGHSSGGGLALRFGGSQYSQQVDAYLLMAPFLKYNAPTARKNSDWAIPNNNRIAGIVMLNNVGIKSLNHMEVIRFNMPKEARDGTETLAYTYRLNTAYAPKNYKKDFANISQSLLVLVGTEDEVFLPEQYPPTISKHNPAARVELVPGVTHQGIVVGEDAWPILDEWLKSIE
jgi:non-heme chloroperoxidase